MSSPLRISALGRFARSALDSGVARVIAVFERSVYVETRGGLACIGAVGNGPLNANCETLPTGLRVGDLLRVDAAGASIWRPRPAPERNAQKTAQALHRLREVARGQLPTDGFGYLIEAAREPPAAVKALVQWFAHPDGVPDGAAGIIGLGPGLTPSGDDLIGGALCALHASGRAEIALRLAGWALPLARNGTNRISYAHLACAAEGECAEAVNDAIAGLIAGDAPDLRRIDAIGHTSGWDALAGATLALTALCAP